MLQNFQIINKGDISELLRRPVFLGLFKPRKKGKARNSINNQKGFTLVEILVALTLMVIGIFAVISMQLIALQSNSIANQLTVATSLASEAIEDISSSSWYPNGIALTNGTGTLPYNTDTQYGNPYSYQSAGVYTTTCNPLMDTPTTGLITLDVTVTYFNKGNSKSVTLTGYKRYL